ADAGIHDERDFRDALTQNAQVRCVLNSKTRADRRSQRHHRGGTGVDEFARSNQIVIRVRQDYKSFFDQNARGFDELLGVGEKRLLIADDFKFYPVRETYFTREASGANGLVRGITA